MPESRCESSQLDSDVLPLTPALSRKGRGGARRRKHTLPVTDTVPVQTCASHCGQRGGRLCRRALSFFVPRLPDYFPSPLEGVLREGVCPMGFASGSMSFR